MLPEPKRKMRQNCTQPMPICPRCGEQYFDIKHCLEHRLRVQLGYFDRYFLPRTTAQFGDVDGLVEIHGHALLLEWKSTREGLKSAQSNAYLNLSRNGQVTVIAVSGVISSMTPVWVKLFRNGTQSEWQPCEHLDQIGQMVSEWVRWALKQPVPSMTGTVPDLLEP